MMAEVDKGVRGVRLENGKVYRNRGGGNFVSLSRTGTKHPMMRNTESGWTFKAYYITMYGDGSIEWDYSLGGHFEEVKEEEI